MALTACRGANGAVCLARLPRGSCGNRDPLRLHQGFQQSHGFGERVGAAATSACAAGDFERSAAAGVFGGEIGAVGYEEFDELIEAVFGGAMQGGLVRNGVRARHLTAATEGQRDARGSAVICWR